MQLCNMSTIPVMLIVTRFRLIVPVCWQLRTDSVNTACLRLVGRLATGCEQCVQFNIITLRWTMLTRFCTQTLRASKPSPNCNSPLQLKGPMFVS